VVDMVESVGMHRALIVSSVFQARALKYMIMVDVRLFDGKTTV
jgi:hypothetical protein